MGLELELHSNRTLSYKGEKMTITSERSINATTHSYSVQQTISFGGHLIGLVFVYLKEVKGRMSDNIKAHLFKPDNVVCTRSASGKVTTSLVEYWKDHVLQPLLSKNSKYLLLSDSWSTQEAESLDKNLQTVERLEIPRKTTSLIQPLDVYFNRQWKAIARNAYDRVRLDELSINISERNNIIRLQSLIRNQMRSPIFVPMIKFAWYPSIYTKQNPSPFQNVKEACFSFISDSCSEQSCDQSPFITCSWCEKDLCFDHCIISYHTH